MKISERVKDIEHKLWQPEDPAASNSESASGIAIKAVSPGRLRRAKQAFSTRRIALDQVTTLLSGNIVPQPGDVVLARVDTIGQHAHTELPCGRKSRMFEGDEIIVAYGNRYAPDQFEALVPSNFSQCDLVAGGGIASASISRNAKVQKATRMRTPEQ
jgi:hypothetical protein